MPFGRFGLWTVPSLQPAAVNAVFAAASFLPTSFGTMHPAGRGGSPCGGRVYEIDAEQAEVLPAASVAVAEKAAVTPSPTSTRKPGEPSSAALPEATGVPAQLGPA